MANILANKYRPKQFSDMIGQDVPVQVLTNSVQYKKVHHAYILGGSFGCGKSTAARILSASLNCVNGPTVAPCGVCSNCVPIFQGKSQDVREIDAARYRGIEEIRSLADDVKIKPIACKYKIFIIDEAHGLSALAADAALKMIEEPPPNVIFIFCTTDTHAIKPTIFTRCVYLKFNQVKWEILQENLKKISDKESINIDDLSLKYIARAAKGSVRTSIQLLDSVFAYCGNSPIKIENCTKALGLVDNQMYYQLIDFILKKEYLKVFTIINNLLGESRQVTDIIDSFLEHIRGLILGFTSIEHLSNLGYNQDDIKKIAYQVKSIPSVNWLFDIIGFMREIKECLDYNIDASLLFEKMAIQSIEALKNY